MDFSALANGIEKYVSQYEYTYTVKEEEDMVIEVSNASVPHLLGLSKNHHVGLPGYQATVIFEGLKSDWTLESLRKADKAWFDESRFKIIGVCFLYQIMHLINSKAYSVKYVKVTKLKKRLQRDNIYFVIVKLNDKLSYTLELSPKREGTRVYVPRSMRINDKNIDLYDELELTLKSKQRIEPSSKVKKVKWK